ncbi:MAG: flagellar biosynthetic protein FliO, partial [Nitrososphaerales archaeon]
HAARSHGSTGAQSVSATSLLVQMVVGLVVIIFLIKMASKFVQGRGGRSLSPRSRSQGVTVVGRQSLGKGVQVAMVAAGAQTYLLGVTQHQVTLLGEIDSEAPASGPQQEAGELQLLRGGSRPALSAGGSGPADGSLPAWKSAIEQMRVRTARRA